MSSRRTLILIGAVIVGIVAAGLLYNYIQGIEDKADEDAVLVEVYSAKADIVRGTTGQSASADGLIGAATIPQQFKPATAVKTLDEIQRKVAIFDIAQNTVIVEGMFVDPAQQQISFRARLKDPEHVAITISADEVHAVAGFLVPGDEVNLMVKQEGVTGEDEGMTLLRSTMRFLYQKVQILAVGSNVVLAPGESVETTSGSGASGSNLITFNVPPEASQWIASAAEAGGLYLSLVAEDYKPGVYVPLPNPVDVLPGEDPTKLTPYGPDGNPD